MNHKRQIVYQRSLYKGSEILGGPFGLARFLRADPDSVVKWLSGELEIPEVVFLRVVDLLLNDLSEVEKHAATEARHVAKLREQEQRQKKTG